MVEPTSFAAPMGLAAARLTGSEAWLHVQDLELGAALNVGLIGDGQLSLLARRIYGQMLARFDRVTTLSNRMRTALAAMGRAESRIGLFPNWVDAEKYRPVDASTMRAELRISMDEFVVLYAGAMGEKQGVESLLDVASLLEQDRNIRIVLCGAGPARVQIQARMSKHANVLLLEPQPEDRYIQLLSMANCHVLPQRKGVTHFVMPSKLGPMLASGKSIVAQADNECAVAHTLSGIGIVVPCEDSVATATAIASLALAAQTAPKGIAPDQSCPDGSDRASQPLSSEETMATDCAYGKMKTYIKYYDSPHPRSNA